VKNYVVRNETSKTEEDDKESHIKEEISLGKNIPRPKGKGEQGTFFLDIKCCLFFLKIHDFPH
jgi:hypothetical protein